MSREIKFRLPVFYAGGSFDRFHYWGEIGKSFVSPPSLSNRISSYGSQQFTGLLDNSGNRIYESDIISMFKHVNEVVYHRGAFGYNIFLAVNEVEFISFTQNTNIDIDENGLLEQCEIIGNIHENGELLK